MTGVRFSRLFVVVALLAVAGTVAAGERFVPVVAQVRGADSSYWNTELWVSNFSGAVGTYALTYLPAGTDNSRLLAEEAATTPIGPGETVHIKDVVPPGKKGALRVVASEGIVVRCRVFNTRGEGSVGQLVPALSRSEMIQPGSEGVLVPLLRGSQFRTNVGIFNPGANPIRVHVAVVDEHGTRVGAASYGLEPGSQKQINDFMLAFRVQRADGYQAVLSSDGTFAAYASLVDSRTGAATFVLPVIR